MTVLEDDHQQTAQVVRETRGVLNLNTSSLNEFRDVSLKWGGLRWSCRQGSGKAIIDRVLQLDDEMTPVSDVNDWSILPQVPHRLLSAGGKRVPDRSKEPVGDFFTVFHREYGPPPRGQR